MEISSPPYPKNSTSPRALYRDLCELYAWTAEHREWANDEARALNAPEDPFVPELGPIPIPEHAERFTNLAVLDMYVSWQALRKIRERYDEIVRNYESASDWDSKPSIFHRIHVVRMAAILLSVAFLDYEHREAKGQEYLVKATREFMEQLKRDFSRNIKDLFKQNPISDSDMDDLFNLENN